MPLSYNGITFQEPVEVLEFTKEPEYDDANNYLWSRCRLTVLAYYNPASTAYSLPGGQALPVPNNAYAYLTEVAVRHKLAQSRGQLTWTMGGSGTGNPNNQTVVLQSPAQGMAVDANNGPTCTVHAVKEVQGVKTFLVLLTLETCINEAGLFVKTPSVMLSNVWRARHHVDADAFTTRVVTGTARFRSDRLAQLQAVPDDFRAYLFVPLPAGFWRADVDVEVSEDGTELDYTIIDKQVPFVVTASGVTRIEATHTCGIHSEGLINAARNVAGGAAGGGAEGGFFGAGIGALFGPEGAIAGALFGGAAGALKGAAGGALQSIPRQFDVIIVRAWGNPMAPRSNIHKAALTVLAGRLAMTSARGIAAALVGKANAGILKAALGVTTFSMTDDVMGRFTELHIDVLSGPLETAVQSLLPAIMAWDLSQLIPFDGPGNIPGVIQSTLGGNASQPIKGNGALSLNARGTYLGRCAAAALLGQDATPAQPADPGNAVNKNPP